MSVTVSGTPALRSRSRTRARLVAPVLAGLLLLGCPAQERAVEPEVRAAFANAWERLPEPLREVVQGIVAAAPLGLTQDAFEAAIREVCAWVLGLGDPLEARAEARRVRARRAWDARELERCGRLLYEPLRPAQRVRWAVSILARCVEQAPEVSAVRHLLALAASPEAWGRAHTAFYSLRELTIQALANGGDPAYRALLELAETTAKVVYNASDEPAPFHYHRGWRIPLRAWAFAQQRDAAFRAGLEPLVLEP